MPDAPAQDSAPLIRAEQPADEAAIRRLVGDAFGDEVTPRLVDLLRRSPGYVPELELVAVVDGELAGHVMLTYVDLVAESGEATSVPCLSPLAVAPAAQRRGIGSALVRHALAAADERGEPLVILEGNPALYHRYGFVAASGLGIERPFERIPEEAFMCRPLGAYDPSLRGRVVYSEPFVALDAYGPPAPRA